MSDLKLGKLSAKRDKRNFKIGTFIRRFEVPSIPDTFFVDWRFVRTIEKRMFLNDLYGCCVLAAQANQLLRFEMREQNIPVTILDKYVKQQYFEQTGGEDSGVYLLDSLKIWQNKGWKINHNENIYPIHAFAEVNRTNQKLMCVAIYLLDGLQYGIRVPQSAMDQFYAGKPWDVVKNDGGIIGGHAVNINGYTPQGPVCLTWEKEQQMSWAFSTKYGDEGYAVVDNRDAWLGGNSPLDIEKMDEALTAVRGGGDAGV